MKKKVLFISLLTLMCCGCFNSANKTLSCTIHDEFEGISTDITVVTKFKKKKATSSEATAVMHFKNEEEAKAYYEAMEDDKEYAKVDGKDLIVSTDYTFKEEEALASRAELKILFENDNYTCK